MSRSDELFRRAQQVTPGGVHSPVRAFGNVGGSPRFIQSANGATLHDVDGNDYTDFCMAFGPLILGHQPLGVKAAAKEAIEHGWSYGAAEEGSLQLAELITGNIGWVDSIRFVNSGTEAVMSALRIARAVTGRDKILKFDGCYHGHADAMLAGASAGIAAGVVADTLTAPLDDDEALETLFAAHGTEIAAAIIEPVPANFGLLPQRHVFLESLAQLCRSHGALLIFDEVITGFRLGFGGYSGESGLHPDLVTWGKIIGGGFPVGAIAGARELMENFAPVGKVYQAGTLSGNPVAMAAGFATLEALLDGGIYTRLEKLGQILDERAADIDGLHLQRYESMFWLLPGAAGVEAVIRSPAQIPGGIAERYAAVFHHALSQGIYLPPSCHEVGFLSAAHQSADIDRLMTTIATA